MGIGTMMPHLLGVPLWDGRATTPKEADALGPHHLDILPSVGPHPGGGGGGRDAQ